MLKYAIGVVLGVALTVSAVTLAAKSGEVWLTCYAKTTRAGMPEVWTMTLRCGKGDILDKVALR